MKRSLAWTTFALCFVLSSTAGAYESVTGPLAQKLTGSPPAISVGGKNAQEIKDKMKSGAIKRVVPPATVPAGVEATMDVEYGKGGKTPLLLDLFQPKEIKRPVPGLIFVHGGSWSHGTRKVYDFYCEHFAKHGYVAATIEYRLSGQAPFPAAIQDVKCAIRWMRANAARLGVDPHKIGHLVLYGPVLLTGRKTGSVVKFMGGKSSDEAPALYAKASPILHLTKDAPPTLILHGTVDELVAISQSDMLAAKLGDLGVPYLYDRQEGWHHAMDAVAEVNVRCVWMMDQFFAQVLPLPTR